MCFANKIMFSVCISVIICMSKEVGAYQVIAFLQVENDGKCWPKSQRPQKSGKWRIPHSKQNQESLESSSKCKRRNFTHHVEPTRFQNNSNGNSTLQSILTYGGKNAQWFTVNVPWLSKSFQGGSAALKRLPKDQPSYIASTILKSSVWPLQWPHGKGIENPEQAPALKVLHNFVNKTSSHDSTNGKIEQGNVAVCHGR